MTSPHQITGNLECPNPPLWTFTQGFIVGQATILALVLLFFKYVVFEDPIAAREAERRRNENKKHTRSHSIPAGTPVPTLLSSLEYDLSTHPPESADWLNVIIAQALSAYRSLVLSSTRGNGGAVGLLEEMFNRKPEKASDKVEDKESLVALDRIFVEDVSLGEKQPVFSNARVRPTGEGEAVRIELDIDYVDHVSVSVSTALLINFPKPRFAILPVALRLTLQRFSGTLTLELQPPVMDSGTPTPTLFCSLHPDFCLELSSSSLLGSRARLQDVPKVEQLILARIRAFIQDKIVWPRRVPLNLPGISSSARTPPEQKFDPLEWELINDKDAPFMYPNIDPREEQTIDESEDSLDMETSTIDPSGTIKPRKHFKGRDLNTTSSAQFDADAVVGTLRARPKRVQQPPSLIRDSMMPRIRGGDAEITPSPFLNGQRGVSSNLEIYSTPLTSTRLQQMDATSRLGSFTSGIIESDSELRRRSSMQSNLL